MSQKWTYRITGALQLESDMHIGSGAEERRDDERHVSTLSLCAEGKPVIPGSSLKGALRSVFRKEFADNVLGHASDGSSNETAGCISRLWIQSAKMTSASEAKLDGLTDGAISQGVFEKKGVALDARRGAAEDNKLFAKDVVHTGATFGFRAVWFGKSVDLAQEEDLLALLNVMTAGFSIGSQNSTGYGRMKLDAVDLRIKAYGVDADGKAVSKDLAGVSAAITNHGFDGKVCAQKWIALSFTLQGDGPFISKRGIEKVSPTDSETVAPLEFDGKPVLWREGLKGALRSRARWLEAVSTARSVQRTFAEPLAGKDAALSSAPTLPSSACDSLFGTLGQKARLVVSEVSCTEAGASYRQTSNSIDRITGGVREHFLFTERSYWSPTFNVTLHAPTDLSSEEKALLVELRKNLEDEGLEIGHGSGKGYGWFDVKDVTGFPEEYSE